MRGHFISCAILLLVMQYILLFFTGWVILNVSLAINMLIIILLGFFELRGINFIISLLFFLGSIIIFFANGFAWKLLFFSLTENMPLIALVISVPFLSLPLARGGFEASLTGFYQRYVRNAKAYVAYTTLVTYILTFFVNIAAVPLVFELVDSQWRKYPHKFTAAAVTRGFSAATIWAPNVISIAIILQNLPVTWSELVPGGALISALVLLTGFFSDYPGEIENNREISNNSPIDWRKISELFTTGSLLVFLILVLKPLLGLSVVQAVPVVAWTFPILWLLIKGKKKTMLPEFRKYFQSLPRYSREVVVFTAAGCFAAAIEFSAFDQMITSFINSLHFLSPGIFSLLLLWFIIFASIFGIHPIITITVFISAIDPMLIGLRISEFALLLLIAWSLGISVSPVGTCNVLTAVRLDEEASKIGPVWNLKYAILVSCLVAFLIELS